MIAEIITIGEELLTGKIVDTNAAYLAKELSELGFSCLYRSTVGDNTEHIKAAIMMALTRSNVVLMTGGLGPTADDKTMRSIASLFEVKMVFSQQVADKIESMFKARGLIMPETNLKQAYFPDGASIIENPIGTAPGIIWNVSTIIESKEVKLLLTFPGVPQEMKTMWTEVVKPTIASYSEVSLYERYINFLEISESQLVQDLDEYIKLKDPIVLPYANNFQIQLRVYSRNKDKDLAKSKVEEVVEAISVKMSDFIYGYDDDTIESVVGKLLIDNKLTVSVAESCTGGLLSSRLTDISGSSAYIKCNYVTYANQAKIEKLNIPQNLIELNGAVSPEVAEYMAENVRKITNTDYGISVTGIAGPSGGTNDKPVGLVYIGIADKNGVKAYKRITNPNMQRTQIKWRFTQFALNLLRKNIC